MKPFIRTLLFISVFLCGQPYLFAQVFKNKEAEKLAIAARYLFEAGKYKDALAQFLESYEKERNPNVAWNIARCYEELGDVWSAIKYFKEFMTLTDDQKAIAESQRKIDYLIQNKTGTVKIEVNEKGAGISIDGRAVGLSPLKEPIPLVIGTHNIRVVKPGFKESQITFDLTAGENKIIKIKIEKPSGIILVKSDIPDILAKVWVDGNKVFEGLLPAKITAEVGTRLIKVSDLTEREFIESIVEVTEDRENVVKWIGSSKAISTTTIPKVDIQSQYPGEKVSILKSVLFWGGLGIGAGGGALHLWGYLEWRGVNDGKHYWKEIEDVRGSASRKYWSAFALYGIGAAMITLSFVIQDDKKHPISFVLGPDKFSLVSRW